ncbi:MULTISPECIES: type I-E CRISPR-associated protein Cas6/Cse3/CasE [Corynebacterium]|uniref:type I-E CRISPR-associated protein Cas6/Cse3/CasE n=1 Tax=Corynebacterium TaxID=1716 RepID=UPI00124DC02C|nr:MULTISPECIES: type I-E CRISPR-associated protein Cas6/Cse3/CasE [Corynebacterium]
MTTFTRLLLNPRTREGRKLLTDPQSMHAAVRACFPPDLGDQHERILWRVDSQGHEHRLYIVGPETPTCTPLVEQAGWSTRPAETADYEPMLNSLRQNQFWRFELVANPTYSEPTKGQRGKVKAHVSAAHQLEWLYKRSANAGFVLPDRNTDSFEQALKAVAEPRVMERRMISFSKGRRSSGHRVRIAQARFSGVLQVTDADILRQTLTQGIGRARAYGCGLMTLAKIQADNA